MVALDRDGRPRLQPAAGARGHARPRRQPGRASTRRPADETIARARSSITPSTCSTSIAGTCATYRSRNARGCCAWCCASTPRCATSATSYEHGAELPGGRRRSRASRAASPTSATAATSQASARAPGSRSRLAVSRSWSWSATSRARAATDLGSLLVATHEADGWRYAGKVGSGIDAARASCCARLLDEASAGRPPTSACPASDDGTLERTAPSSSAPSSPSGRRMGCCARRRSRGWRSAATRSR